MYGQQHYVPERVRRQLENEGEFVGALVKSQSVSLWAVVILFGMLASVALACAIIAMTVSRQNRVCVDGEPGAVGPQGASGRDGVNGTSGVDGVDGLRGNDGLNGSTISTEVQIDSLRGLKAEDARVLRLYDDTPNFAPATVLGPYNGSVLAVQPTGVGVGVGATAALNANLALEIHQSLGALLLPRFSSVQRNALTGVVPLGTVLFDTNLQAVCVYAGSGQWYSFTMTAAP
jgi:hypothetical protein